ncbi:hypothetical protein CMV_027669 [Castanea mollissima]|uniref:Uncharacterized protein n=1 Tax=Castanea mollissima TaxID=60419 RepID=A0A8J4V685_9ROSI|nr:hypothetical protein CMV_027669 [Castanea mollissima]
MSSAAKNNGTNVGAGGGFMSKMDHFLYSKDKKHVTASIAVLTVIFGIPWSKCQAWNISGTHFSLLIVVQKYWKLVTVVLNISPIKITWKRLIKHRVKDFLQPLQDVDHDVTREMGGPDLEDQRMWLHKLWVENEEKVIENCDL